LPSCGVKLDAVPGRMNQVDFMLNKRGIFFGQCSEFCGLGHGYMPIKVISTSFNEFFLYIVTLGGDFV